MVVGDGSFSAPPHRALKEARAYPSATSGREKHGRNY